MFRDVKDTFIILSAVTEVDDRCSYFNSGPTESRPAQVITHSHLSLAVPRGKIRSEREVYNSSLAYLALRPLYL